MYESVTENSIKYKCISCNKDHSNIIDEELKKRFKNIFKFSTYYFNKFILLLRRCIHSYEQIDEWRKFNKTLLPKKKNFIVLKYGRFYRCRLHTFKKSL